MSNTTKWFIEQVKVGLEQAQRGDLIDHEQVVRELLGEKGEDSLVSGRATGR